MSTPRERRNSSSLFGKSLPTTATTDTGAKKLAATEKNVAEPPRTFSTLPNGVSTLSNATEPTTTIFTSRSSKVFSGDDAQPVPRLRGNPRPVSDDRLRQRGATGTRTRRGQPTRHRGDDRPRALRRILEDAQHLADLDVARSGVPAIVVGDQRERGEAHLGLARELGLLDVGHPDDVGAPRAMEQRLGARGELRPLHAHIGASVV